MAQFSSRSSVVSTGNSTTTPLGASATFIGTSEEVLDFNGIRVFVFSNQNSAANGLKLQWSHDGTTFRTDPDTQRKIFASTLETLASPIKARFFRIQYTNGGSAQGTFTLQTILVAGADNANFLEVESRAIAPGDRDGRTKVTGTALEVSAGTTLLSAYGGVFKIQTIVYSAYNNDTASANFRLRDGIIPMIPFLIPGQALPAGIPHIFGTIDFGDDPLTFNTDVNIQFIGTNPGLRVTMFVKGYEEFLF